MSITKTAYILDTAALTSSGLRSTPPEILVDGTPDAESWPAGVIFSPARVRYGIWQGQVGAARITSYPNDEVFCVQEGHVRMEADDGVTLDVLAGQSCFIPRGWAGVWRNVATVSKTFIIFETENPDG